MFFEIFILIIILSIYFLIIWKFLSLGKRVGALEKDYLTHCVKYGTWIVNQQVRYVQTQTDDGVDIEELPVDVYICPFCNLEQGSLALDWDYCPKCGSRLRR